MAAPFQEAIETFISITGASESVAAQKLEEHGGDLNAAVNAHFNEGDRSNAREAPVAPPPNDYMDIDEPVLDEVIQRTMSLLSSARATNPFALLDSSFTGLFDDGSDIRNRAPRVTHPRVVREIPIEVKDSNEPSGHSGSAPIIEDVTDIADPRGPVTHGTVILDDEDDDDYIPATRQNDQLAHERRINPSVPEFDRLPDYNNDIEEEMIRAAIEASKRETEGSIVSEPQHGPLHLSDAGLAEAVSLSLKTAEQEKTLREQWPKPGEGGSKTTEVELKDLSSNGRLEVGSSSLNDDPEDLEEQPLVRHRSRRLSSGSMEFPKEVGVVDDSPPSSPRQIGIDNPPQHGANAFASEEWGGISSLEHDEAVMLEAAMFGGVPDENRYPYQFMQNSSTYARPTPRPPSPALEAQRLIREQQDDEYLASLQADREKAEARRLEEEVARQAALEEERMKEEESRRKVEEEQEYERRLAAKEASLPEEPASDNENAVNLLVRMPDGTRRGRRFLKSDRLQSLFDFIDIGRNVKPGSYRLVRPYPRRAFSDGDSGLTLNELGLTSRQEALFIESI